MLNLLRDGKQRTKADLVRETGIPRSTLTLILDQLVRDGYVTDAGIAASSGGRRPTRFRFNPDLMCVVVLDFGATHGNVAITDLSGQIISSISHQIQVEKGPVDCLDLALTLAEELLQTLGRNWREVLGIGTGVPGPVEYSKGTLNRPPIMPGWDGFDIPSYISSRVGIGIPTFVDNDVNLLTIGEHAQFWPNVQELLYVKVSTGIGAGLIQNGHIQRGAQGSAGDLGQVQVPHNPNDLVLEQLASARAVAQQLERITGEQCSTEDLMGKIAAHDTDARLLVRDAGRKIGEVLAIVINLLNPAAVVIGGRLGANSEDLTAGIREIVYKRATPLSTQDLVLSVTRGGEETAILGAARMVVEGLLGTSEGLDRVRAHRNKIAQLTD